MNPVLPPVIDEGNISIFKFWYNDSIQNGMYYRGELFYKLRVVDIEQRSRLYHYACKMALKNVVAVTANDDACSLWVSLRSPGARFLHEHLPPELISKPFFVETSFENEY